MESNSSGKSNRAQILRCLKDGDMQAFSLVYNFYWDGLYTFALRLMKEESLAQDVLHDVFTELWARHKRLNIESSLKTISSFVQKIDVLSCWGNYVG